MDHIRSIKPEFFQDEALAELAPLARLLFVALWCQADRSGRLEDRPARIKVKALPYDDCDVDAMLTELQSAHFIQRYEHEEKRYIQVLAFARHQRPNSREPESELPAPRVFTLGARARTRTHAHAPREGKGTEGNGKGKERSTDFGATRPTPIEVLSDEVVGCWNTRQGGKHPAERSASHVALVDKLDKAKYTRAQILLVALVAAHHERGTWYREHDGNEGLLIALSLGGRPRLKDGVVASLTKNHFAALLEAPPLEYGPQMALLLEAKGLTEAAAARGWKPRAA